MLIAKVGSLVALLAVGVASYGGSASASYVSVGGRPANASSVPVQSGYGSNETFCAEQPLKGTISYLVTSGRASLNVAVRGLPRRALIEVNWANNTVRGYLVGTLRTDGRGVSIPSSSKLYRTGETRGYRLVLTWPSNTYSIGNLWPCGPPPLVRSAVSTSPMVAVAPSTDLVDGGWVKASVTGFGVAQKVYLSECDSAEEANALGCGSQLAAQPFILTDGHGSGSTSFVVRTEAATGPLTPTTVSRCAQLCVIVATQGANGAWAVAPIGFVSTSSTASAKPNAPLCANGQIAISDPGGGAGLSHEDQVLVFTNKSANACTLTGYPGVAALNSAGQQVVQARRTAGGYMGGLGPEDTAIPAVLLRPDQAASAIVEGTDNPVGQEKSCATYPDFLVTPPNLTTSVRLAVSGIGAGMPGCTPMEVQPVVYGTSGSVPG
jgi:Domain of unknown function (DUF4232)/Neocarzinostatin family